MQRFKDYLIEAEQTSQPEMHKTLKKHGWTLAAKDAHKTNGAVPDRKREAENIKKLGARSEGEMLAHLKTVKYYTHPDRPQEAIKTTPGGHQYSVWTHMKYADNGTVRGTRGKSGAAMHLAGHLEGGASPTA